MDLSKLLLLLKENSFFKNLVQKRPYDQVLDLISKLKYEFKPAGDFIFHHGDEGIGYYIILEGDVSVRVPIRDA